MRADRDRRAAYHDRALGREETMPAYDVKCSGCAQIREERYSYADFDRYKKGFSSECPRCGERHPHAFVIMNLPGVEWRTDGVTTTDWADPHTKYQREHFQESGTRSEERRRKQRS